MNTFFQDIEYQIIKRIKASENRLLIAVAWFTNPKIGDELIKKKNIDIEIILDDNAFNRESKNIINLIENGIDVVFIKDEISMKYLMHNKFCVIDSKMVITGSYNWTYNANTNNENITILKDANDVAFYSQEFRRIKSIKLNDASNFYTDKEFASIIGIIYKHFVALLKKNIINDLEAGLFLKWTDIKIKNQIRTIEERHRNTLLNAVETFVVNGDLNAKYGIGNLHLATENEKIEARDNFKKEGLFEIDYNLNKQFSAFKLIAVQKLQRNYGELLRKEENNDGQADKILRIIQFLSNEKVAINKIVNPETMG